ncbi:hypothetical protein LSCM1_07160 [Leishmania martiniquensis]|uniref:Endonuclease/exonuclease/phosphatase domain-containing protein n=1 Tax=Leishmania martiniquensis TaxID=1580590 RepID=A0A836KSI8_9TRYP|nr:hypothetical protein LSCM1_07160 [Leishmania martiniquensis]
MSHVSNTAAGELPIRVLTFNLWGIFNSKMRVARMKAFAAKVEHYDVILLQEQFSAEDFDLIFRHASPLVQQSYYFRRFPSAFYGSGCAVISRYPIHQAFFHIFPLQGYPEMVLHGDFFANKGAAMVRVMVPVATEQSGAVKTQEVTLYITHLVAIYQKVSQLPSWKCERYLPFRISQAVSLANFIISTSHPADRIIIGGDFNCSQRSLEVQTMLMLLKRNGYDILSVLPSPKALPDAAAEREGDGGQQLFTFSERNAFNAMSTSYFKLLNLQSDIPAQIDHIFFSRQTFALRDFADCPDVAVTDDCPRSLQDTPSGVIVFTKDEVYVPPTATWCAFLWHLLTGRAASRGTGQIGQATQSSGKTAEEAEGQCAGEAAHYYPLSDHFGVAALLGMRVEEESSAASKAECDTKMRDAAAPSLTPEEARVLQTVVDFLEDYVCRLRSQAKVSRYIAISSLLLVATNIWALRRLSAAEEERAATVLEQMYVMAAATNRSTAKAVQQDKGLESVKHVFNVVKKWVSSQWNSTLQMASAATDAASAPGNSSSADTAEVLTKSAAPVTDSSAPLPKKVHTPTDITNANSAPTTPEDGAATAKRPDFCAIARALVWRPLWASVWVSSALNISAAVVGTLSFAIGTFQRAGNANILEEQVGQLKLL